jgi:hypothetical protein
MKIHAPCSDVVGRDVSGIVGSNKGQRSPLTASQILDVKHSSMNTSSFVLGLAEEVEILSYHLG